MLVLGVDPGLRRTGLGLIRGNAVRQELIHCEVVRPSRTAPVVDCLKEIGDRVSTVLDTYRPDLVAVERIYVGKDPAGAFKIGQVRGAVIYLAAHKGVAVAEYTPTTVKQAVVGYGRATKQQVKYMIEKLFRSIDPDLSFDEADALALALCHLQHHHYPKERG